ncbi:MAG: putative toxin-antitoxin system toxin component, PIN family [Actinomycetota bacterium]|nr:putative toxin-antitoxin system toxin component, PIN family [Actinomycetota bacterium]
MLKIVADANVYISAILFGGKPEEIIGLARQGRIELLLSGAILDQVARVLKRKFDWSDWQISEVIDELRSLAILITPKQTLAIIKEKESDNRVLECAVEGKAQYIVSGDKRHLLALEKFQGIEILSPAELLKLL